MTETELLSLCESERVAIRRRARHRREYLYLQRSHAGRRYERYLCPVADLASRTIDDVRACIASLPGSPSLGQPAAAPPTATTGGGADDRVRRLLQEVRRPVSLVERVSLFRWARQRYEAGEFWAARLLVDASLALVGPDDDQALLAIAHMLALRGHIAVMEGKFAEAIPDLEGAQRLFATDPRCAGYSDRLQRIIAGCREGHNAIEPTRWGPIRQPPIPPQPPSGPPIDAAARSTGRAE